MFVKRVLFFSGCVLSVALCLPAQTSSFPAEDRNRDGTISREEWQGNLRDFRRADWNRDGVLSGTELPDDFRQSSTMTNSTNRNMRGGGGTGRARVNQLDKNNSGAVEGYEWPYNSNVFHQLDKDANSVLTSDELTNLSGIGVEQLDRNGNRRIDADEWPGGFAQMDRLDENRDGKVSQREYFGRGGEYQRRSRFDSWDTNRNGTIESSEWRSTPALFRRMDTNRNGSLDWDEFMDDEDRYNDPAVWRR